MTRWRFVDNFGRDNDVMNFDDPATVLSFVVWEVVVALLANLKRVDSADEKRRVGCL